MLVTHSRELEEVRNDRRIAQSEVERMQFKCTTMEDERQKQMIKMEKMRAEVA